MQREGIKPRISERQSMACLEGWGPAHSSAQGKDLIGIGCGPCGAANFHLQSMRSPCPPQIHPGRINWGLHWVIASRG